jgi:outer membrane lipopolysaccharide assembly protein LptE/RlpB
MRARRAACALVVLAGVLAGGCGYTIGTHLPPNVKTIAVPTFKNLTQQPSVEDVMTAAMVTAFSNSGVKVVPVQQADSILEGEVVEYNVQSTSYDSGSNALTYRLRVKLNIQFRDVRNNTMIWRQEGIEDRSDFRAWGDVAQTLSAQNLGATSQAAVEIARRVVSLALDRF